MVRMNLMGALAVALAAGAVQAQETRLQPVAQPDAAYRLMTVQEMGKPALKCRVLADWPTPEGTHGYKVQAIDTGEILTVIETACMAPMEGMTSHLSGSTTPVRIRAMTTRIYHEDRSPRAVPSAAPPSPYASAGAPMQIGTAVEVVAAPPEVVPASSAGTSGNGSACCDACGSATAAQAGPPANSYIMAAPATTVGGRFRDRLRSLFAGGGRMPAEETVVVVEGMPPAETVKTARVSPVAEPAPPAPPAPPTPAPQEKTGVEAPPASACAKPCDQPTEPKATVAVQGDAVLIAPPPPPAVKDVARTAPAPLALKDMATSAPSPQAAEDVAKTAAFPQAADAGPTAEKGPAMRPPSSVTEASKRPDPLVVPERLERDAEMKLNVAQSGDCHPLEQVRPAKTIASTVARQTGFSAPGAPVGEGLGGKAPLGARSVLAASAGMPSQVTYMPVPIVTVPDVTRPPLPPEPRMPAVPPPAMQVNAFTPPLPPGSPPTQMAMMPPALPGYPGVPMSPEFAPNPYAAMQAYGPNPYGMGVPGVPVYPYAGSMPVAPQHLMGQPNVPASYQGPLPPNPMGNAPVMPVVYMPNPADHAAMDRQYVPAMVQGQPASPEMVKQLTAVLRDSLYPSQREIAACSLAACDWQNHPSVLQALLLAVRQDPAPSVRAACVSSLGKMHVTSEYVLSVLRDCRHDSDPRVRQEVEQTFVKLTPVTRPARPQGERSVQAVAP